MLHAEAMIAQHEATGEEVRAGHGAKKQVKAHRRTVSKLQQLVYELGKFLCVQGGKGVKEDEKGIAFTKWCLLSDRKDQLLVHLRMKPVVGTRYHVYHYNPRVIFILRQVYLDFIPDLQDQAWAEQAGGLHQKPARRCRLHRSDASSSHPQRAGRNAHSLAGQGEDST